MSQQHFETANSALEDEKILTNGCSFRQAFLSSPNRAAAIPDILFTADVSGLGRVYASRYEFTGEVSLINYFLAIFQFVLRQKEFLDEWTCGGRAVEQVAELRAETDAQLKNTKQI